MKKILSFHIILLAVLMPGVPEFKAQNIEWTKVYGGSGDDGAESMVVTDNDEIVITGFKTINNLKDVLLMKTDAAGNQIWSRTYNLGINDWARSLKQTLDGGFIIGGMTEVEPQVFDPFLIKTDADGNVQWEQQYDYGFGEDDRGHSVSLTSDGGYILAGQTWLMHGSFGNYDMYFVKTDIDGNVQWKQVYFRENDGADVALSIQQLDDGGYIAGGFTQSSSWASYIIRMDSQGNAVWSNIYPGSWQSECYEIQATPDGGFIYTGTESSFQTDTDLLIAKLDGSGSLIWKKIYGTIDAEQGEFIKQLQDGYFIAGMSSHGSGSYDMYVVRTDPAGDSLWSRVIGGSGDDRAFAAASQSDGSYLAAGWTWSYGQGLGDVYLVNLSETVVPVELISFSAETRDNNVILQWATASEVNNAGFEVQRKNGNQDWLALSFIEGSGTTQQVQHYLYTDNAVLPANYTYRIKQIDYDGMFKYSNIVSINVGVSPAEFLLAQNYPNPFNPATKINYSTAVEGLVTLRVYDITGKEIITLVNEHKAAGNYKVNFDASEFASGVYFYRLESGSSMQVKKMILVR